MILSKGLKRSIPTSINMIEQNMQIQEPKWIYFVIIILKIRPDSFIGGAGCCRINNGSKTDEFIKKTLMKHGDKQYKYDKVKYVKAHAKI